MCAVLLDVAVALEGVVVGAEVFDVVDLDRDAVVFHTIDGPAVLCRQCVGRLGCSVCD